MILDGLGIPFDSIDITKPEHAEQRRFMRENASKKGPNGAVLPPQFFYEDEYLGVSFNLLRLLKIEKTFLGLRRL